MKGWDNRASARSALHSRAFVPASDGRAGGPGPPIIFDRQAFRDELVHALVDGDEIDFHFALELAGEEERAEALSQLRDRIAGVDHALDQTRARLDELAGKWRY
jgi:hypothetical protein